MKTKTLKLRGAEANAYCRHCKWSEHQDSETDRLDSIRGKVVRHVQKTGHSVEIFKTRGTVIKPIIE